jgi:hypothetical protein
MDAVGTKGDVERKTLYPIAELGYFFRDTLSHPPHRFRSAEIPDGIYRELMLELALNEFEC